MRSESVIISKEKNISAKLVDQIIDNFESTLRYYLTHPQECPGGILLPNFCSFKISLYHEQKKVNAIINSSRPRVRQRAPQVIEELNTYKKHARQKKIKNNNE